MQDFKTHGIYGILGHDDLQRADPARSLTAVDEHCEMPDLSILDTSTDED
jgi:hypothetical protein